MLCIWLAVFVCTLAQNWTLKREYHGKTFFDRWTFFTHKDENVELVNRSTAEEHGLVKVHDDGSIYMGVEHRQHIRPNTGVSRLSVEIHSVDLYTSGLFIVDIRHLPAGCGVWPAFWLCGPTWPTDGEIDIIEGVNSQPNVQTTLHTGPTCTMQHEDPGSFTGAWMKGTDGNNASNCYVHAPNQGDNQGCSISGNNPQTFGNGFNKIGGGVYATLWDPKSQIAVWFFPRGNIPKDVHSYKPDPSRWGKPMAYFDLNPKSCPGTNFIEQQIIFDISLCSDWAGRTFRDMCPGLGDCISYVDLHPSAMKEAFWHVDLLRVFQQ